MQIGPKKKKKKNLTVEHTKGRELIVIEIQVSNFLGILAVNPPRRNCKAESTYTFLKG